MRDGAAISNATDEPRAIDQRQLSMPTTASITRNAPTRTPTRRQKGRSTYFGNDGYSIHKGSCGLGYQFPDVYPGTYLLAGH